MHNPLGRWNRDCKQREQRLLCHESFWWGDDRAHAINLSPGGMCFRVARRANPGEVVTLHKGPALQIKARIAWTRQLQNCTEVGVQFADQKSNLDQWLECFGPAKAEAEPILALPAPGQTFSPLNYQAVSPARPIKMGKSWQAAANLMGPK